MKSPAPFFSPRLIRWASLGVALLATLPAGAADKNRQREKVEFTRPAVVDPTRPSTEEEETRGNRFRLERRESINEGAAAAAGSALPAPEQVNRSRALQEMLDRQRALISGAGVNPQQPDDPAAIAEIADERLTIEEMFSREERARAGRGQRLGDDPSAGLGREGRDPDNREFGDRAARLRERLANEREGNGRRGDGTFDSRDGRSSSESSFLPGVDSRFNASTDPLGGGRSGRVNDLNLGGSSIRRSQSSSLRENDDTRGRLERMESFRKLIGTSTDTTLRSGVGYNADPVGRLSGVPGASGAGAPGAGTPRSLGEALGGRPGPVTAPLDPLAASRTLALPSRSSGLDLPTARGSGGVADLRLDAPPPRAIDMFRQKHDARIPSRDF